MKLNPDCVRDILLTVEKYEDVSFPSNTYPLLNEYPEDVVLYHIKQCNSAGLLSEYRHFISNQCDICDLSSKGHEFIANIRNDSIFSRLKDCLVEIGVSSIPAMINMAAKLIKQSI